MNSATNRLLYSKTMSTLQKIVAFSVPWLLFVTTMGCTRSNRAGVDGQVTLDGKVVEGGSISFIPTRDNPGPAAFSLIKAGSYLIPPETGPGLGINRVEIRWSRKSGRKAAENPALDEMEEAIPIRYNSESELTANLKPGKNQLDFTLDSHTEGDSRRE
jgi:hypothetical protein